MSEARILDSDIVPVRAFALNDGKRALIATLFWGDRVTVVGRTADGLKVQIPRREWDPKVKQYVQKVYLGVLPKKTKFRDDSLLKVRVIDVGQGDGSIVESPKGQLLLIDGGEEQHIRRYISGAFAHAMRSHPLPCSAIVVTHGDADHYAGLTRLLEARMKGGKPLVTAEQVFHNGLVKRGAGSKEAFGRVAKEDGVKYAVELEDDLRSVATKKMNKPFREWHEALRRLKTKTGGKPRVRRLEYGQDDAFDFLRDEGIGVKVLGPVIERIRDKPALRFLGDASHTVNGHSIVLKLTYGNVRFLFGADLNIPSEERLLRRAQEDGTSLTSEFLKVPHHGSAEFSPRMLEAVRPVVSVISSGDESGAKEYIHPRAGLVGALGKYSRATVEKPLVYVTEMVAFFERLKEGKISEQIKGGSAPVHNPYRKKTFGIVHVRTDGQRVLVVTHSGKDDKKESYAFNVDDQGAIKFELEVRPER